METNTIPNIQIEQIGKGKHTLNVIKGFAELPCWTGYFLTEKPNYVFKTTTVENGRIPLWVDGTVTADSSFHIAPEQVNAYFYLLQHQDDIKNAIVQELKQALPVLLENDYAAWDQEEGGFPQLPDLTPAFDFKNYIGPGSVSIAKDVKEGLAYITWNFQCLWDPEHGFEVITYKDRVIDIAPQADVFKLYKDNGTYEAVQKELNNTAWKLPKEKKWWQLW